MTAPRIISISDGVIRVTYAEPLPKNYGISVSLCADGTVREAQIFYQPPAQFDIPVVATNGPA
jgi:hypothetical protein